MYLDLILNKTYWYTHNTMFYILQYLFTYLSLQHL